MNGVVTATSEVATLRTDYGCVFLRAFRCLDVDRQVKVEIPVVFVGPRLDGALLRINSACVTSEVFGDLRCDCRHQLHRGLCDIAAAADGLLIYAPCDEGYGNGLLQKLNSFAVMDAIGLSASEA